MAVVPRLLGLWRDRRARRRVPSTECNDCGYPLIVGLDRPHLCAECWLSRNAW